MKTGNGTVVMVAAMMVAGAVLVGAARGAPVPRLRDLALKIGETGVVARLAQQGITNAADLAAIAASGWEEEVALGAVLRAKAYRALWSHFPPETVSEAGARQIRAAVAAETGSPLYFAELVRFLPAVERGAEAHLGRCREDIARRFPGLPEFGRLYLKYVVLRNEWVYGATIEWDDLVALLLAPEPLEIRYAELLKSRIKDRAVRLARERMHAQGLSFVMQDGVNPLAERVRPLVEALNAPECRGLEGELRSLGCDVPDRDRTELRRVAEAWRQAIVRGEVGTDLDRKLGKLSVALGPEGYNRFVELYNHGTGGAQ